MSISVQDNEPSIPQILHALILALVPFIDSLLADTTRPHSPALRGLARTLRALRAFAALFPAPPVPAPGATQAPPARPLRPKHPAPRARTRIGARPLILAAIQAATTAKARRPGLPPEPARTLEL